MYIQIVFLLAVVSLGLAQFGPLGRKPGECPPFSDVGICEANCFADIHCEGTEKCCRTACGGFFCTRPVSQRYVQIIEKPGQCPSVPTGPWVCSSRCAVDSDCRGKKKCCKNRCGAFACVKSEEDISNDVF